MDIFKYINYHFHTIKNPDSNDIEVWKKLYKEPAEDLYEYLNTVSKTVLKKDPFVYNIYVKNEEDFIALKTFLHQLVHEEASNISPEAFKKGKKAYCEFYRRWNEDNLGESWEKVYKENC